MKSRRDLQGELHWIWYSEIVIQEVVGFGIRFPRTTGREGPPFLLLNRRREEDTCRSRFPERVSSCKTLTLQELLGSVQNGLQFVRIHMRFLLNFSSS